MTDPILVKMYEELMALDKNDRISKLHEYVDDLTYASKSTELHNMEMVDIKLAVDGLSSALGMAISHIRGNHRDPWEYMQSNILCAHWKVFQGKTPEWRKEAPQPL